MQSQEIGKLVTALIAAQPEFKPIKRDATNPFFKSKYATLDMVIDATGPALRKNGLVVIQTTDGDNLVTTLAHTSGEFISGSYPLSAIKQDPQGMGSALTYARRYTYTAIVGAAPTDEDDDGESHRDIKPPEKPKGDFSKASAAISSANSIDLSKIVKRLDLSIWTEQEANDLTEMVNVRSRELAEVKP